jgi:hypothetical protein
MIECFYLRASRKNCRDSYKIILVIQLLFAICNYYFVQPTKSTKFCKFIAPICT